ncbi:MAG TPA: hypothetical protein VFF52_25335 [Isosphaeraceae bacterium]|nr:hypothetical protein [Isosphaeraceae bacterium]
MIRLILAVSVLATGQAASAPPKQHEPKAAAKVEAADNSGEDLAKYNELREKTPETAAAQWKLGIWCEQHGLKAEAYVHFATVARLDPRREAAWRKLGLKKYGGRWLTDEQIAEENEQKKADKAWGPRLRAWHKDIHGTNGARKRDLAQAAVHAITDPRAILPLYREFGGGGQLDQMLLIQVLGQINKPISSKVLAMLAVFGRTPEVRQRAAETLRQRPADDFLDLLVGLMRDPLKYEIKPVGGPGSPGVLFVEGEQFNVSRFYAPPMAPNVTVAPGDFITFDQFGMPVINRPLGFTGTTTTQGVPGSKTLVRSTTTAVQQYAQISPSQLMMEAQRAAVMAEAQLEGDVERIKAINEDRKQFSERVMAVAKDTTGKDLGRTPKEWREALASGNNSSKQPERTRPKPTVPELVALDYNPLFGPVGFLSQSVTRTRVYVDT